VATTSAEPLASVAPAPTIEAGPAEVRAWFSLKQKSQCDVGSPEYGKCYVVMLSLRGSVEREIVVAKNQWGQDQCGALHGKSVVCSGASGMDTISLHCSTTSGACDVISVAESDGYCPPPEDCSAKTKLTSFALPAGAKLTFAQ
jgi:hypothetical protein